jgi:hypothetical protein
VSGTYRVSQATYSKPLSKLLLLLLRATFLHTVNNETDKQTRPLLPCTHSQNTTDINPFPV